MIGKIYLKQIDPDLISTPPWDIAQMLLFYFQFSYRLIVTLFNFQERWKAALVQGTGHNGIYNEVRKRNKTGKIGEDIKIQEIYLVTIQFFNGELIITIL